MQLYATRIESSTREVVVNVLERRSRPSYWWGKPPSTLGSGRHLLPHASIHACVQESYSVTIRGQIQTFPVSSSALPAVDLSMLRTLVHTNTRQMFHRTKGRVRDHALFTSVRTPRSSRIK